MRTYRITYWPAGKGYGKTWIGSASSDLIVLNKFLVIIGDKEDNSKLNKSELYSKILNHSQKRFFFIIEEVNEEKQVKRILISTPFVDENVQLFDDWDDDDAKSAGLYPNI
jgi:hypothetical protein